MQEQTFQNIELDKIRPSPWNPRQRFEGRKFDELVASVQKQGVIEPILVRPVEGDPPFEIVAGERRYRALADVAGDNGGPEASAIPAMVRELSDDDAFELMTIENLHREDLTELEEAESFKAYLDRKGDGALAELADRTGINARYIRRRVAVLDLPKKALTAWGKGELKYGHLEQLTRLKDKKVIAAWIHELIQWDLPVRELKRRIDNQSPELKNAKFDLEKAGCTTCHQNSDMQKDLFGDLADMSKTHCLNPKCFKQKQNNHIIKNWKQSGYRKQHKTNGFRFHEDVRWEDFHGFYNGLVPKACKACANFVTLIHLDGSVYEGKVCIGDKTCYDKTRANSQTTDGQGSKQSAEENDGKPRLAWHGDHFRQKFFREQIPLRFEAVPPDDVKALHLALFSLLKSNSDLHGWFAERVNMELTDEDREDIELGWFSFSSKQLFAPIAKMTADETKAIIKEAGIQVTLQQQFGSDARRLMAEHFGIDLAKEWRFHEEYLQKKTIKELLALGEEHGIFSDRKAQAFLYETLLKKRGNFKSCKKSELILVFLDSGVDLAGKVPAEILAEDA